MFRKSLSILLAVVIMMGVFTALPITVNAKEKEISSVGVNTDLIETGASNPYNYYATDSQGRWANCTWWAWQIAYETTGVALPAWSHARTWYASAQSAGYYCDTTASPNSIVVKNTGEYGHVQFVTEVSNGQLYVKEGGYWYSSNGYNEGWTSTNGVVGYIHLGGGLDFNPVYMGEHFYANIINPSSGKAVVATGDNAGSNVVLQNLDGILLHKWEFIHLGNNAYKIVNNHSGKVLDVNAGSNVTGTNVQVWDSLDNIAQKWFFKAVGNGYSLVPQCAPNLCLDIYNGYTANGTNIQICTENNSNALIFTLAGCTSIIRWWIIR